MITIILTAILAFIVYVNNYNDKLISFIKNTKDLCETTIIPELENNDEHADEAKDVVGEELPLIEDWLALLLNIRFGLGFIILLNFVQASVLLSDSPASTLHYVLNTTVALCDATAYFVWQSLREKREYIKDIRKYYYEILHPNNTEESKS